MIECEHQFRLCRRILSNGVQQIGEQCETCGAYRAVKQSKLMPEEINQAADYDSSIRDSYYAKCEEARRLEYQDREIERQNERAEWWDKYKTYLMSPAWMSKRQKVLQRDDNVCQACLRRRASQVHHKTYDHVFAEPLFDLISVCDICHLAITQMDRSRRA